MAEALTSPFAMHGARDAISIGLVHIEQQVRSIEQAVVENPGLACDLAKTLVESVCRTVLSERSIAYNHDDDLPKLFRTATNSLPFLPAGASAEGEIRRSLAQTLPGLHTTVQGICELRNQCEFASHGPGSPHLFVDGVTAVIDPRRPARHATAQAHLRRPAGERRRACTNGYANLPCGFLGGQSCP